jgi:tetratricopeptide (TPR) repeat protein
MTGYATHIDRYAPSWQGKSLYKTLFLALSALLLILMPVLSFDAGITDDEGIENEHGVRMMNYYLGRDTSAASSPVDSNGEWILQTRPFDYAANKNIYGGFFDMTCAFMYRYVTRHIMGEYESKHFFIALTGVLLFILTGLIAFRLTGSWLVALIALLFSCLSPRLIGHSFNDPKDIPFAAAFAFGLYQIIDLLQAGLRLTWRRALLLIIAFIVAIDIRVGGIMLIVYLLFFAALYILCQIVFLRQHIRQYVLPFSLLAALSAAGYLGASLFWPWAAQNPIANPLIALKIFSRFNQFNSIELFEGVRINNNAIPWYFVIKWFYISFPLFILTGFFLFFSFWRWYMRDGFARVFSTFFIVCTVILPLAVVMVQGSNVYDDARHLYFVLPSIVALCAIGWYWFLKILPPAYKWPAFLFCFCAMLQPFLFMVRNHPHEAIYFSPIIGGEKGAFKRYEMDYWGFSLRAAINWLDNTDSLLAKNRKTKVRLWYGEQRKLSYYTEKSKHLVYAVATTASPDWDYWLVLPAESKHKPGLLENWPPPGTVHQIMADGAPLCAIVRNPLSDLSPAGQGDLAAALPPQDVMGRGMVYYNAKDYNKAIIEFKKILQADSNNMLAYNNLVASFNLLAMYRDAIDAGERGMRRFPTFELLRNNVAVSKSGAKNLTIDEAYLKALSYNYFTQGEFQKCIDASQMTLKLNPISAAAYNNICCSNNALGNFKAGKAAGEKAHMLAPDDQLIKNNIAVSIKGIEGK